MPINVLSPDTKVDASPIHTAVQVEIKLSPDPEDGDVYRTGNWARLPNKWAEKAELTRAQAAHWSQIYGNSQLVQVVALTNIALLKVFNAIDAEVVDNERVDQRTRPHCCEWNFSVRYTKPDGSQGMLVGDYELDLRLPRDIPNSDSGGARYSDLVLTNTDKLIYNLAQKKGWRKPSGIRRDDFLEDCWLKFTDEERSEIEKIAKLRAERAVTRMQPHLISRAQTGARNRALRSIGIRSSYYPHELEIPLAVRRIKFDWDKATETLGQEQTRALMLALVEKQLAIPAREMLSLMSPKEPPTEIEEEPIEAAIEEVEPEPKELEKTDDQDVLSTADFSVPTSQLISLMGSKEDLECFLAAIADRLVAAGFDTEKKRGDLLKGLFGTAVISRFQAGWFRLLQVFSETIHQDMDEAEMDKLVGIVQLGVKGSMEWGKALEAYDAQSADDEEPEEIPI